MVEGSSVTDVSWWLECVLVFFMVVEGSFVTELTDVTCEWELVFFMMVIGFRMDGG